jgi:hypothetical protein
MCAKQWDVPFLTKQLGYWSVATPKLQDGTQSFFRDKLKIPNSSICTATLIVILIQPILVGCSYGITILKSLDWPSRNRMQTNLSLPQPGTQTKQIRN